MYDAQYGNFYYLGMEIYFTYCRVNSMLRKGEKVF